MIVYVVRRRWFEKFADAEIYRRSLGLKGGATTKITVEGRSDLAELLNALCEPPRPPSGPARREAPIPAKVIDEAFVDPSMDDFLDYVPRFLLDDDGKRLWAEKHGVK